MYKIAVIGQRKKIIFWRALGVEIFPIKQKQEIQNVLETIKKLGNFGIVLIDQLYLKEIKQEIEKTKNILPVVLGISLDNKEQVKQDELKSIIKRATGTEKITIK